MAAGADQPDQTRPDQTQPDRAGLAAAQERLVASLVAGAPVPAGFDARRVGAAARALLRKRAGEVAGAWPRLAAAHGREWPVVFARWAGGRPPPGAWRDGFDFARDHRAELDSDAAAELRIHEALWVYDGVRAPRRRRLPALRRVPGGLAVAAFGRVRVWPLGRR